MYEDEAVFLCNSAERPLPGYVRNDYNVLFTIIIIDSKSLLSMAVAATTSLRMQKATKGQSDRTERQRDKKRRDRCKRNKRITKE